MNYPALTVFAETPAQAQAAQSLARSLNLPYLDSSPTATNLSLVFTAERLEIRDGPCRVYAEFVKGAAAYRRRHEGRNQALAKAVGLKSGTKPLILDVTAGLGRDAFFLASLGCRVFLLERSPIISALLADGLRRASLHPETAAIAERMCLETIDALHWLSNCPPAQAPEVVYLDPMYPPRHKSALVKKESRVLRMLAGEDADADLLLPLACRCAQRRVVVKRPRGAPPLANIPADAAIHNPNTRFDLYFA